MTPLAEESRIRRLIRVSCKGCSVSGKARAWKFENMSTPGKTITKIEKNAGSKGAQVLTGDDPEPQTVYHT